MPPKKSEPDPATGVLNALAIVSWSPLLADHIGEVLENGEFPVVLGGDCTIMMGSMLALKRRGRYGLMLSMATPISFSPRRSRTVKARRWNWPGPPGTGLQS